MCQFHTYSPPEWYVQNYCDMLSYCIGALPSDILNCVTANCKHHQTRMHAQDI